MEGGYIQRYVTVLVPMCLCMEASRGHQESYHSYITALRQVLSLNLQLDWQPASLSNPPNPACAVFQ